MGAATGRKVIETEDAFELRETPVSYNALFDVENDDIEIKNTCLWDIFP